MCFIHVGLMILSKYFHFSFKYVYQAFPQNISLILSNYSFRLQCSAIGHSGNLSEKNLNSSYKLFFEVVMITRPSFVRSTFEGVFSVC